MSNKRLVSIIVPLLQTEKFFRTRLRNTLRHHRLQMVENTAKKMLRGVLPYNVRQTLRRWWVGGFQYPTAKALPGRFLRRTLEKEFRIRIIDMDVLKAGCPANAIVRTTAEEGKFFVKVFSPNENSVEQVQEEVQVLEYLVQHGIHTPVLRQTRTGQTVLRIKQAYPVIVMREEKLRVVSADAITEEELRAIARSMARMHRALSTYPRRGNLKRTIEDPDFGRDDWLTYHRLFGSPWAASFSSDDLEMVRAIDRKIVGYMKENFPPRLEEFSVIHGDLALEHAPFLPDGNVYFLDFADVAWGPIARDLAVFLVRLYTSDLGPSKFERWEQLKEWALDEYRAVNGLSPVDMEAIKPMMIKRLSEGTIGYDTDILEYERSAEAHVRKKLRRYRLLEYLLRQV